MLAAGVAGVDAAGTPVGGAGIARGVLTTGTGVKGPLFDTNACRGTESGRVKLTSPPSSVPEGGSLAAFILCAILHLCGNCRRWLPRHSWCQTCFL